MKVEEAKPFKPRAGSTAERAFAHLALRGKTERNVLADAIDCESSQLDAHLSVAVSHQAVIRSTFNRNVFYELKEAPKPPETQPFPSPSAEVEPRPVSLAEVDALFGAPKGAEVAVDQTAELIEAAISEGRSETVVAHPHPLADASTGNAPWSEFWENSRPFAKDAKDVSVPNEQSQPLKAECRTLSEPAVPDVTVLLSILERWEKAITRATGIGLESIGESDAFACAIYSDKRFVVIKGDMAIALTPDETGVLYRYILDRVKDADFE